MTRGERDGVKIVQRERFVIYYSIGEFKMEMFL